MNDAFLCTQGMYISDEYIDPIWSVYGHGIENNSLGADNCMSSKSENPKISDSFLYAFE